jgi:hypothetical protein
MYSRGSVRLAPADARDSEDPSGIRKTLMDAGSVGQLRGLLPFPGSAPTADVGRGGGEAVTLLMPTVRAPAIRPGGDGSKSPSRISFSGTDQFPAASKYVQMNAIQPAQN